MHQPALQRQRVIPFRHVLGEICDQSSDVDFAKHRRGFAHRYGTRTEGLDYQTEACQVLGARGEPCGIGLVEFDDLRDQQDLARDPDLSIAAFMRS